MEELLDCVWGCGLPSRHDPYDRQCPGGEQWVNGPDKALGTDRQLLSDVAMLRDQMVGRAMDRGCIEFLRKRINVIGRELDRRGRVTA